MIGSATAIISAAEPGGEMKPPFTTTFANGVKSGCKVFNRTLGVIPMAGEKNFENRLKEWLESEGIYPLGEPVDRMSAPPCGFYEKRWGGSRYVKSGSP